MVRPFVECIEPTRSALHDALQIRTVATRSVATHMRNALAPFSVPGSPAAPHCSLARKPRVRCGNVAAAPLRYPAVPASGLDAAIVGSDAKVVEHAICDSP